jgi:hypothetical protein
MQGNFRPYNKANGWACQGGMASIMKKLYAHLFGLVLLTTSLFTQAQNSDLSLNGIAAFEQLRKEYYIGALYLGWPGHDQATIANMPGKKRMAIHITAFRTDVEPGNYHQ